MKIENKTEKMKFCKTCGQPIYSIELEMKIKEAQEKRKKWNLEAQRRHRMKIKEMKKNEKTRN